MRKRGTLIPRSIQLHSRVMKKAVATADAPRSIIQDEVQMLGQKAARKVDSNKNLAAIFNREQRHVHQLPPAPSSRN